MTKHQQSAEQLFGAALDLPPKQRRAFLDRACQGSPELRRLVEELLLADEQAGSFLESPLFGDPGQYASTSEPTPLPADGTGRPGVSRFQPSEIIADRFLVVRFIAAGGMGEVYEVEDRFLHNTRVALKIIRPELAADPSSSHRFEQEVLLARKINHRNLCPIYEIFRCEKPAPPFLFLTMKFLEGETLEVRLRRSKFIPPHETLLICNELIAGVRAIHEAGVVHRDIKPNNVMLERSSGHQCVTIMDFGLARIYDSEATILKTGQVAGTPGYMAPELFLGNRPSQATDLFALGVVLHQVLTGERPIESKAGLGVVTCPQLDTSDGPPHLVSATRDFLSTDPYRRCRAFDRISTSVQSSLGSPRRPLLTRRNFALGTGATICGLLGGTIWKQNDIYNVLHPLPSKRFVALLNWPPPSDVKVTPMLMGLIDAMASELARAEAFDHNFFVTSQSPAKEMTTKEQLNSARESLGANLILATSGSTSKDNIHVVLNVLDPNSAKALRSKELRSSPEEQFSLPQRVIQAAAELLNVAHYQADDKRTRPGTENPEALAAFQAAEALVKQPNGAGLEAAVDKYKLAVELDPHFAQAYARLAMNYLRLHDANHDSSSLSLARNNAETALSLDPNSVGGHQALGSAFQQGGDKNNAFHEYSKALAVDPSDPETILYQARFYTATARWSEAEEAYNRVIKARPNNPDGYIEFGYNCSIQGKYKMALQQFEAGVRSAPHNAMLLRNMADINFLLGDLDKAADAASRSIAASPRAGAYVLRADIYKLQGKYADALEAGIQATKLEPEESSNWLDVGDTYSLMPHRDAEARNAYKHAEDVQTRRLDIDPSDGYGWMLLALYRTKLGDSSTPIPLIAKAEELNATDLFSQLIKLRILELLGKREEALATLQHCMQMGVTTTQLDSTNDLGAIKTDPRYENITHTNPPHLI